MSHMTIHPHKKTLLLFQKYALLVLLCAYFLLTCLGLYQSLRYGASSLFYLIEYFTVAKSQNSLLYWVHLIMGCFIFLLLLKAIPSVFKQIKRLKAKP